MKIIKLLLLGLAFISPLGFGSDLSWTLKVESHESYNGNNELAFNKNKDGWGLLIVSMPITKGLSLMHLGNTCVNNQELKLTYMSSDGKEKQNQILKCNYEQADDISRYTLSFSDLYGGYQYFSLINSSGILVLNGNNEVVSEFKMAGIPLSNKRLWTKESLKLAFSNDREPMIVFSLKKQTIKEMSLDICKKINNTPNSALHTKITFDSELQLHGVRYYSDKVIYFYCANGRLREDYFNYI